ncbi:polysaccharide deacetylase family protein [Rhodothermaceae bacterium RA]|nr:polysaccharide deacetylase family protein [Rhodothermaceae bacterium RA]
MSHLTALAATYGSRLLRRHFPDLLWHLPHGRREAYLTFDDGPTPSLTARLIDLLDRYDVRATFFLIGSHARRDPGLVRALHAAGHTIGNHTYTHPDAWRTPVSRLISELEQTTALLEDLIQHPIRWMRPPYGRFTRAMRDWCRLRRQRLTMWDVMPADYLPGVTTAQVIRRVDRGVRAGSIVVLHDNPRTTRITPAALETLLPRYRDAGWRFRAL